MSNNVIEENKKSIGVPLKAKAVVLFRSRSNPLRAAFLFGFASLASWMPLFNVWLEDAGLNGTQIGFIAALPWGVMLLLQPVWGVIADKYGKIICLRISILVAALFFLLLPAFGSGIIAIAALTLLVSAFNSPVLSLLDSIALDKVDEGIGISYSNIRFWGAPGYALGATVTGWLIPLFGIKVIFFTSSLFLILVLLALQHYKSKIIATKSIDIEFKDLNRVLTGKIFLVFLFIILLVSIGQSSIFFFLGLYMKQIGASPEITGTAIGVQALSELPFYFVAAWMLKRINPNRGVLIAIFGTALRLFFYSINNNPNTVIFIETMNGVTWTLLWIASVEFVNKMVPTRWRTTGQSMLWAAYFGAGAISGNIIIGRLYQHMPMQKVYLLNSIAMLIVAVLACFIFLFRKKEQPEINV